MKVWIASFSAKLKTLSPATICAIGLVYILALAFIDYTTPGHLSFYCLGTAFAGWGAGKRPAAVVSLAASVILLLQGWEAYQTAPHAWLAIWNTVRRVIVVCAGGWVAAELAQLTRTLGRLVAQRTARWKAEAQRHKTTAESLRVFLNAIPGPAFLLDPQGIILVSNQALARALARPLEAVVGQYAFGLIPPEVAQLRKEMFEQVLRSAQPVQYEDLRNGRHLMSVQSPVLDAEGKVSCVAVLAYDITERKRLERQILEISDREQARMGQDLHDGLCQQLVSLAFDANSLEAQFAAPHSSQAALAGRLADGLDQAITEARQLSRGLFPIRLVSDGLPSALEELARSVRERSGLDCRFESHGQVAVADRVVATHLYRIAQEAVSNALKHARPTRVTVRLQAVANALELTVEDDGCGLPAEAPQQSAGMGLHIMGYRARTIGATLRLAPGAQGGTTVTCRLAGFPVRAHARSNEAAVKSCEGAAAS